jgi:SNF2 family DNA or RNA helicase
MREFQADDGPRFILCSAEAAWEELILTRANHCFMISPWFNASVENQAMDRVYRIGQTRNVRVVRFCMKSKKGCSLCRRPRRQLARDP